MTKLTINQALQQGIEAHEAGQVQEADRLYTAILQVQPKHPDANHNMGVLAVGVGKVQEALPFFKTALEANPAIMQFWLSYIDTLIKLDKFADAKAVFDQVTSKGAKGEVFDQLEQRLNVSSGVAVEALISSQETEQIQSNTLDTLKLDQAINLAKKKAKDGSPEEAIRIYQDILVKFPKNKRAIDGIKRLPVGTTDKTAQAKDPPQDQIQSLINLYTQGQLKQTLEESTALLQLFPNACFLYNIRGIVFRALGQLDASIEAYTKALAIKPDYVEAYYNMGNVLKEQGKLEKAIKAYNKAVAIKPDYFKAYSNIGVTLEERGKLEEAIEAYRKALAIKPDYAEAYNNMGNTLRRQGKLEEALEAYNEALIIKPGHADTHNNMGVTLHEKGKLEAAMKAFNKALAIMPDYAKAYNNMGNILKEQGKLEEAIEAYNEALIIKPDYADAYNNMGVTLHEKGKLEAAMKAYNKALAATRPNYADAYNNIGRTLHQQGKLEEAIETYSKALAIKPDFADAYNNMGFALKEQGKLEKAIEAYNKALTIKPDYAEAYNNMGNILKEQGKLEEAIEAYSKALAIKPDYAEAYNNMGVTLYEKGKLKEAIKAYKKSLAIKPNYISVWNNIAFSLQSIKLKAPLAEELTSYYPEDTGCNHYEAYRATLNYILNFGTTHAESAFSEALKASGDFENLTIKNPNFNSKSNRSKTPLPEKVVALVHWGRSGTGLLHSLIDNHPEVSTLPSSYLSEYFNYSNWEKIISDGWSQMAARFIAIYDVIFDARSKVPIQTKSQQLLYNFGLKEGMANVGDQRDEVLKVDKDVFRAELQHLMNFYDHLDALLFFNLVHLAYDKAIGDVYRKTLIFYHIHNPDTNAQVNFVKSVPEANWIMMVRQPLQSCESWLRQPFEQNNYIKMVGHIRTMLFEIDTVIYHKQNSAGVRLEDLKERPRQTIPALCNWMGIEETESLYEMTAQGKKWWGDPSSPDFAQNGMNPFGKTSINRKIGSIFSERDQYILQTLFYPFSVRFGYVEENEEQFEIDLQAIRPMLDKMFDFEKVLAEKTHVDQEHFMKSGSYLYLRSGLIERWATLNEFGTYPNMIEPLQI